MYLYNVTFCAALQDLHATASHCPLHIHVYRTASGGTYYFKRHDIGRTGVDSGVSKRW